jgi:urate oxidase
MLAENSYGKSGIRLVRVIRGRDRHRVIDLTVAVRLEGDFAAAHLEGDNRDVLPTDTMKNTVYALAAGHALESIEAFGLDLASHFLDASPKAERVRISICEHPWEPIVANGRPHPHAFRRLGPERGRATVTADRDRRSVEAGLEGLLLMKTTDSAFSGFARDRYTTLAETRDRIFATEVTASWRYTETDIDWNGLRSAVRQTLVETFARHESESVQHTLYAMGEAVFAKHPQVVEIRLSLPNKHHLPVNLTPFGLENKNEVFVATEEPYGLIEAVLRREQEGRSK